MNIGFQLRASILLIRRSVRARTITPGRHGRYSSNVLNIANGFWEDYCDYVKNDRILKNAFFPRWKGSFFTSTKYTKSKDV